jgi:hypothetical protein
MANLDDYREVPERIHEWYVRHPEGRIVCTVLHEPSEDRPWWTVKASCYRTQEPLEEPSGVGHSFLEVPGKTNFTRGSELENAETSAAGRALVMAGIPASRVSSGHEVSMKGGDEGSSYTGGGGGTGGEATGPTSSPPQPGDRLTAAAATALKDLFPTSKAALAMATETLGRDVTSLRDLTNLEGQKVVEALAESRKMADAGAGYGD